MELLNRLPVCRNQSITNGNARHAIISIPKRPQHQAGGGFSVGLIRRSLQDVPKQQHDIHPALLGLQVIEDRGQGFVSKRHDLRIGCRDGRPSEPSVKLKKELNVEEKPKPKEPSPFEKFRTVAKQIVNVSRDALERREKAWRKRQDKKART